MCIIHRIRDRWVVPWFLIMGLVLLVPILSESNETQDGEFVETFKDNYVDPKRWRILEPAKKVQVKVVDEAFEMTFPPDFQADAMEMEYLPELKGDFEVQCQIESLKSPKVPGGWINLELVLSGADSWFHAMTGIDTGHNQPMRCSGLYRPSEAAEKLKQKSHFRSVDLPANPLTVCMRRTGGEISIGFISEDAQFVEITRFLCETSPMRMHVRGYTTNPMRSEVKFRFDNFKIRPLVQQDVE